MCPSDPPFPPPPFSPARPYHTHTRNLAVLKQNRGGNLSDTTLAYDLPGGRNLNIIHDLQTGAVLWDNERNNGSTYYYYPAQQTCQAVVCTDLHVWVVTCIPFH